MYYKHKMYIIININIIVKKLLYVHQFVIVMANTYYKHYNGKNSLDHQHDKYHTHYNDIDFLFRHQINYTLNMYTEKKITCEKLIFIL